MERYKDGGATIDSLCPLNDSDRRTLLDLTRRIQPGNNATLSGRGALGRCVLSGVGPVIVKQYRRGGLFGKLVRSRYLGIRGERPRAELEMLRVAAEKGIHVPEPIAIISQGVLLYRGWLVLREIPDTVPLAELALRDPDAARAATYLAAREVRRLATAGIQHVDLHPGNVLVSSSGEVWLIDFDKASFSEEPLAKLLDSYICRWRRAVLKHDLPPFLSEILSLELRNQEGPERLQRAVR